MCGVAGIFDLKGQSQLDRNILHAMNQSQFHRGPDEEGRFAAPELSMGTRRLSIIDVSHGSQPVYNEDRTLVVISNGEIYNYRELTR